ncbi:unnamed protein product [Rhizoctonia solani]|uniref:ferric-chelate reductase (NADPH) n=1 Tax=Rhizoctonia solani TaxID=456999 RepID=A0A8H3AWL3_9AGAM|nr:unnamed protein product [Rhizoctonia solani]
MSTSTPYLPFTDVVPSSTASVANSYRPPLATGTGGARPANTASATHYAYGNPNPTTPAFLSDYQWIATYLAIHKMSTTSYRYAYMLWLAVTLVTVVVGIAHITGRRTTVLGVIWRKYTLRRRTWRKQASLRAIQKSKEPHRQPYSLPSNAQLVAVTILFVAAALLCCVGPDYISPWTRMWDLKANLTAPVLARRDFMQAFHDIERRAPIASTPTTRQPEYTIPKAWWTAGGRTGIIAFSLFPLCVLFALKAPPFAVFALPFTTQMHFDKLALLHRWSGRIIWIITTIHVATWGVQLGRDKRHGKGGIGWDYVWVYPLFIYGLIGYILMTLLVVLSLSPIRTHRYETFYLLHVILVPLTLIFSALHFPQIWHWCWVALGLWGGERLFRWARGAWVNGALGPWGNFGPVGSVPEPSSLAEKSADTWEMSARQSGNNSRSTLQEDKQPSVRIVSQVPQTNELLKYFSPTHPPKQSRESVEVNGARRERPWSITSLHTDESAMPRTSFSELIPRKAGTADSYGPVHTVVSPTRPLVNRPSSSVQHAMVLPPPGFAHCVILPGRTVRLTVVTARPMKWAPGQHVLLCVPSVSQWTTHPFTIAGACDERSTGVGARGREISLIIRARAGFTKHLWEEIMHGSGHHHAHEHGEKLRRGITLRASIDGPFGSAAREDWTKYSTAIMVAGGSGVAFALSVLEALCLKIVSGEEIKTKRIRFVWMIREYAHVQWCAGILRRCREMVPNKDQLQIEIFVTNHQAQTIEALSSLPSGTEDAMLQPPAPRFARDGRPRPDSVASNDSLDSTISSNSIAELNPEEHTDGDLGTHVLDYTNFDGEEDTRTAAEATLSKKVKKEGKIRRARSKKIAAAVSAKLHLEEKRKSMKDFFSHGNSHDDEPLAVPQPRYAQHASGSGSGSNTPMSSSPSGTPKFPLSPVGTPKIGGEATLRPPLFTDPTYRSSVAESMFSRGSVYDDSRSIFGADDPVFEMDDEEMDDINHIAELARPGKPKLDKILADEVERAQGELVVACCGPTSLNAAMRKFVADQLSPAKVWRGDMSGSIKLVSEDYAW